MKTLFDYVNENVSGEENQMRYYTVFGTDAVSLRDAQNLARSIKLTPQDRGTLDDNVDIFSVDSGSLFLMSGPSFTMVSEGPSDVDDNTDPNKWEWELV